MRAEQTPLHSGFNDRTTARAVVGDTRLDGRTVLITGGHSGIGLETTKVLSAAGARIHVGARDMEKARGALKDLKGVSVEHLDLSDPHSIDDFSGKFLKSNPTLDLLINNAGIMATPTLMRDARGHELQFATNHLGHFQLTARLWAALKAAKTSRVISLSSYGHRFSRVVFEDIDFNRRPYDKWRAYGQSKTANALFAVELDRLGEPYGIRAFSVHPGRIPLTDLKRHMTAQETAALIESMKKTPSDGIYLKTIEEGAATTVWAALSPQLDGKGGVYCADCDISPLVHQDSPLPNSVRDYAVDENEAQKLWKVSEEMTGVVV